MFLVKRKFVRTNPQGPPCEGDYLYAVEDVTSGCCGFVSVSDWMTEKEYQKFKDQIFVEEWKT